MLGRRSFLFACGCMVTVPAFARAELPSETSSVHDLLPTVSMSHMEAALNEDLVFRIDGWESALDSEGRADERVAIHINSSWRTAWH